MLHTRAQKGTARSSSGKAKPSSSTTSDQSKKSAQPAQGELPSKKAPAGANTSTSTSTQSSTATQSGSAAVAQTAAGETAEGVLVNLNDADAPPANAARFPL